MKKLTNDGILSNRMSWKKTFMVMKSLLVFMFLGIMQLSANVYSQDQMVSLNLKDATLNEIMNEISSQTDYEFLYNHSLIESKLNVDLQIENRSVKDVLDELFTENALEYQMKDNLIVISRMSNEKFIQQNTTVLTGTVKDSDGELLPGVSVFIEGTQYGVATDIDGKYSLEFLNIGNVVITYSFLGMEAKEVKYTGQKTLDVVLESDSEKLDDVVVTGYQTLSKERSTGAFEKVDVGVLDSKSTMNIMDKLEGQTTGVLFDKSGNMEIRGQSTIFANKKPLIVVDGFPIEGAMETINPNDIESITILKDAAAASIWGARAANGVIVIISKKAGKVGKPKIDFSSSFSITDTPNLNNLPVASTSSFLEFEKHYADSKYINLPQAANQYSLSAGMEAFLKLRDGIYTQEEVDAILNKIGNRDVRDEFSDLFLRKSTRQQYSLSISGKTENNAYYASVNYDDNKSFSKQNNSDRIIASLGLDSKLTERLSINLGVNATIRNAENNGIDYKRVMGMTQYQQILDEDGAYVVEPKSYYQGFKDNLVSQGFPYDWDYNTKREFDNADNSSKNIDLKLRVGFNYKIIEGLDFEGRYQYEWGNRKASNLYNEETYRVRNAVNYNTVIKDGEVISHLPKGSILSEAHSDYSAFTTRGQLNFNRSFSDNLHNISAISGIEVRRVRSESSNLTKYGYDPQSLQFVNVNLNEKFPNPVNGSKRIIGDNSRFTNVEDRYLSYYGNIAYTYNEKYTGTASARLDDSNLFGADSNYRNVPLWSVGGNWQMHKEDFFNLDFINILTFRATYGWNGNVDKTTSPYMIALVSKDYETQNQYAYVNNPRNPKLRWEKTSVTNLGIDFSMFNNRLSGSVEYYNKYSDGVLGYVSLNSTYGFSQALMNVAEISNKGIDISLNALAINKAVKWNIGLNFSHNKNRVEEIEMPDETPSSYLGMSPKVGLPINYMYSYKWAGLSDTGTPQVYDENGDIVDHTSPVENSDALKYEGTTVPKFYGSVVNTVSYKGFSLSLLMTYKLGHVFRKNRINYRDISSRVGMRNWIHKDFDSRWKSAGDENKTDIPMYPSNNSMLSGYYDRYSTGSSNTVYDASHIRFKEVIISYNIPSSLLKPLHLSNLRVSAQARNLGVFVFNSEGLDPENIPTMSGSGINTKPEFTFSLKATL